MKVICEVSFGNDDKVGVSVVTNMNGANLGNEFLGKKVKNMFKKTFVTFLKTVSRSSDVTHAQIALQSGLLSLPLPSGSFDETKGNACVRTSYKISQDLCYFPFRDSVCGRVHVLEWIRNKSECA